LAAAHPAPIRPPTAARCPAQPRCARRLPWSEEQELPTAPLELLMEGGGEEEGVRYKNLTLGLAVAADKLGAEQGQQLR